MKFKHRISHHVAFTTTNATSITTTTTTTTTTTNWRDLGLDGWIILGWISRRWDMGIWTGLAWPWIETGGGRL